MCVQFPHSRGAGIDSSGPRQGRRSGSGIGEGQSRCAGQGLALETTAVQEYLLERVTAAAGGHCRCTIRRGKLFHAPVPCPCL